MIILSHDANTQSRNEINRRFAEFQIGRTHANLGVAGFPGFATAQRQGRSAPPAAAFNLSSRQVCFPGKDLQRSQVLWRQGTVGVHHRCGPAIHHEARKVACHSAAPISKIRFAGMILFPKHAHETETDRAW